MQYVQNVFSWLNDVFLEMTWLSDLITWIVNNIFRLPINDESTIGKIGGSIQFFMYDFVKILQGQNKKNTKVHCAGNEKIPD